jgi:putative membrane protein
MSRAALLVACAVFFGCAQLDMSASGGATAAHPDAQLVRELTQANFAEIAAGKLAVSKAPSGAVREYGRRMVEAHTSLQTEGAQLASLGGLPVPTALDARHQVRLKKLEAMSGESFERAYLEQMRKDHAETVALLERTAAEARDPRLRAHAEKALPHERQHLELARHITGI